MVVMVWVWFHNAEVQVSPVWYFYQCKSSFRDPSPRLAF